MLKRLIKYLPVSRQKYREAVEQYTETIKQLNIVIEGFTEAEANHCQIEMGILQRLQKDTGKPTKTAPLATKKNGRDEMYQ